MEADRPLILIGAGGHAKVLLSLARAAGKNVIGVCDLKLAGRGVESWRGLRVLGDDGVLDSLDPSAVGLINGIGQLAAGSDRKKLFLNLKTKGFYFPPLVHPVAWLDSSTELEEGAQVMAGVIIQADTSVGVNSIINTRAAIDHDCMIGAHVHVAPGATLCGGIKVGESAFIGSGATIIQMLSIGAHAIVGAGTVVVRDLSAGQITVGSANRKKTGAHD